ncbi:hypothetical protein [Streptomyces tateyamensis]|nr:hypothetical protein [Streptomyces tateyamensis]
MDESLCPTRPPGPDLPPDAPRFPLPKRHRRMLACAAVAASVALGAFGVAATVETVQQRTVVVSASH